MLENLEVDLSKVRSQIIRSLGESTDVAAGNSSTTRSKTPTLEEFGAESWMPSMVSISIVREIGPVIIALICESLAVNIGARKLS